MDITDTINITFANHRSPQRVREIHHILKTNADKAKLIRSYDRGYKMLFEPGTTSTDVDANDDLVKDYEDNGLCSDDEIGSYYGSDT